MTSILVISSFAAIFLFVDARPALDSSDNKWCNTLKCPDNTVMCQKRYEVSKDDRSVLDVEIRCFNQNSELLKSENSTEENPFGPGVYIRGMKLSAVFNQILTDTDDYDPQKETENVNKKEPKSEVEDLLSK
ncbi:uncharacterized protein LOC132698442 [Cylas formicarius]|uniref:uncharacterized protein LOC132698442 n=1 Tax=Cylas formicarius TaxID=197179 RepID=UPI0029587CC8|nr:uncharacterized protein LOC132698442 [Cylas formicarius]